MPATSNFLVLTALGRDHPGIVDQLSKVILDQDCNILESRMSVLGGEFAILMLVEGAWNTLAKLESSLPEIESSLQLKITLKRTEAQATDSDLIPYMVEVVSLDQPGIVNNLSGFFSERNINIQDLNTTTYNAAHTGTRMFSLQMSIGISSQVHIASIRDEFMDFCDDLNLDAILEAVKH